MQTARIQAATNVRRRGEKRAHAYGVWNVGADGVQKDTAGCLHQELMRGTAVVEAIAPDEAVVVMRIRARTGGKTVLTIGMIPVPSRNRGCLSRGIVLRATADAGPGVR